MIMDNYEEFVNGLPLPYSCVKLHFDNKNRIIDYEILYKNQEFEKFMNIDKKHKDSCLQYLEKLDNKVKNQEFELYSRATQP